MLRQLGNGLYARNSDLERKNSIIIVETALRGATALLVPEPINDFKEDAQKLVSHLNGRYALEP